MGFMIESDLRLGPSKFDEVFDSSLALSSNFTVNVSSTTTADFSSFISSLTFGSNKNILYQFLAIFSIRYLVSSKRMLVADADTRRTTKDAGIRLNGRQIAFFYRRVSWGVKFVSRLAKVNRLGWCVEPD